MHEGGTSLEETRPELIWRYACIKRRGIVCRILYFGEKLRPAGSLSFGERSHTVIQGASLPFGEAIRSMITRRFYLIRNTAFVQLVTDLRAVKGPPLVRYQHVRLAYTRKYLSKQTDDGARIVVRARFEERHSGEMVYVNKAIIVHLVRQGAERPGKVRTGELPGADGYSPPESRDICRRSVPVLADGAFCNKIGHVQAHAPPPV